MTETIDNLNFWVKLNNIAFIIKKIIINYNTISYGKQINNFTTTTSNEIKILAETSNSNYIALGNWVEPPPASCATPWKTVYAANLKTNINSNGIFIDGIFPIDYDFNQYKINVTLSADYIRGDFNLFKLQQLRKAKLKKLNANYNI